LITTRQRD